MSATEAARQKLDMLRKQQSSYQEKLQQQEAELRRLQSDLYQNRTVVELTMPREIDRAYREYLETLKTKPSQKHQAHQKHSATTLDSEQQEQDHHLPSLRSPSSPGSLLSLLVFTTTIILALYDAILLTILEKLLAQVLVIINFFFPVWAAHHSNVRQRRSLDGGYVRYDGGFAPQKRVASRRFAPIHM